MTWSMIVPGACSINWIGRSAKPAIVFTEALTKLSLMSWVMTGALSPVWIAVLVGVVSFGTLIESVPGGRAIWRHSPAATRPGRRYGM